MPIAQEELSSEKITDKAPRSFGDTLSNPNHKKILSVDKIGNFIN